MKFILCLSLIYCSSPLQTPIFKKKNNKFTAELPFSRGVDVKSYEIMVGSLSAKETDFTTLDKKRDQHGIRESIKVRLDAIKNKDDSHLYAISVEELIGKKSKKWYSETFRFDSRKKQWVLSRTYEEDPWYIKHKMYVIGASSVCAVGLVGFILASYLKKKNEESDL